MKCWILFFTLFIGVFSYGYSQSDSLIISDLGKNLNLNSVRLIPGLFSHIANDEDVLGGNTSIRNIEKKSLIWKGNNNGNGFGYFERNRDLGQVFNISALYDVSVKSIIVRTSRGNNAVLSGASNAEMFLNIYEVVPINSKDVIINDNGTSVGSKSAHGFDLALHRADDYIEGVKYKLIRTFSGGKFPVILPTKQFTYRRYKQDSSYGEEFGHLRYVKFQLCSDKELILKAGKKYAFMIGFNSPDRGRSIALAIRSEVHSLNSPKMVMDSLSQTIWGIRREGKNNLAPKTVHDTTLFKNSLYLDHLKLESMFPKERYKVPEPTSNGYPDVDTYRTLQFYIQGEIPEINYDEVVLRIDSSDRFTVPGRWSEKRIKQWFDTLPWLVGCNYIPSTAINQIEMWQASTWDSLTILRELKMARSLGMNTLRVYLHDMVWYTDSFGFYSRMDKFISYCSKFSIRPIFVFFDDCHYPEPYIGTQPLPVKKWHNSGWVNSPARKIVNKIYNNTQTKDELLRLKNYLQGVLLRYAQDKRILAWELYNEPGRGNALEGGNDRSDDNSSKLLLFAWKWAREINPSQPLTATAFGSLGRLNNLINFINSDFYSIHPYGDATYLVNKIMEYKRFNRPIFVTEWLARTMGSTVENCLPVLKAFNIPAYNWGFVSGKTGTIWPWSSRRDENGNFLNINNLRKNGQVIQPGDQLPEPKVWFHDLFRIDGSPYSQNEIDIFRILTQMN